MLAQALDWTKAFDTNDDGAFGTASDELLVVDGTPIEQTDARLAVSGELANLTIAGIITGNAGFELVKSTVRLDLPEGTTPDVPSASMLTIAITDLDLKIGDPDGVNFSITGGNLALAMVKPIAPALPATDTRSWLALTGSLDEATINGLPDGFTFALQSIGVEVNRASGAYDADGAGAGLPVTALPLDWTTAIDIDRDGTAGDPVVAGGNTIDLSGDALRVSGIVDIDIFGFVSGTVAFSFEQQTVDVDVNSDGTFTPAANGDLDNAKLVTIGLEILPENGLFIGVPDGVGFRIDSGSLLLATIKPAVPARRARRPAAAGDARRALVACAHRAAQRRPARRPRRRLQARGPQPAASRSTARRPPSRRLRRRRSRRRWTGRPRSTPTSWAISARRR